MILIVDLNWKKDSLGYEEFVLPVLSVATPLDSAFVVHFEELTSQHIERADKIILTGAALKDFRFLDFQEKFCWLKNVCKPVLGIGAGMEVLVQIFGLSLADCVEIGMTKIRTVKDNVLFSGDFNAYSLHSFCLKEFGEFDVLAESDKCVQAIKHKSKPVYATLFHPEVRNQQIINNFVFYVKKD